MQCAPLATSPGLMIPVSTYVAAKYARGSRGTAPSKEMKPPLVATTTSSRPTTPLAITVASAVLIARRSEEHTSELQSRLHLVCRLLLEKKKKINKTSLTL